MTHANTTTTLEKSIARLNRSERGQVLLQQFLEQKNSLLGLDAQNQEAYLSLCECLWQMPMTTTDAITEALCKDGMV